MFGVYRGLGFRGLGFRGLGGFGFRCCGSGVHGLRVFRLREPKTLSFSPLRLDGVTMLNMILQAFYRPAAKERCLSSGTLFCNLQMHGGCRNSAFYSLPD